MGYWSAVGVTAWINAGETQHWGYGWGDYRPDTMCLATPDVNRIGSFGNTAWATQQGKHQYLENDRTIHEFRVIIQSDGPNDYMPYQLQVVSFP